MAITKKPKPKDITSFIESAPDGKAKQQEEPIKGLKVGNKQQVSLTISPDLLRKVDATAKRAGQTRAAIINLAIFRLLEGDVFN